MKIKRILSLLICVAVLSGLMCGAFAENTVNSGAASGTSGIIDAEYLKQAIEEYAAANYMTGGEAEFSVGYVYTATGDTWYYNGDAWYYSASLYKIPVAMLLEEKETAGEIQRDSVITSQYATDTLEQMEYKSIVQSNNYTGHAMVEYLGGTYNGKCSDQTIKFTSLPESYFDQNFFNVSYYSARYYTEILSTVFNNQNKFPHIIGYMKQASDFMRANVDGYLCSTIGDQYVVAQKYGAYIEAQGTGDNNNHAAGIIYTPNPIIVTVLTKNISNHSKKIGDIAAILVNYTLSLDSKLEQYAAEQERMAREAEEKARQEAEEQERIAAAQKAAEESRIKAEKEAQERAAEAARKAAVKEKIIKIALIAAGVILLAAIIAIVALKIKNAGGIVKKSARKNIKDRDDFFDDYDEYEEEEEEEIHDEEDLLPPENVRSGQSVETAISALNRLVSGKGKKTEEPPVEESSEEDYYPPRKERSREKPKKSSGRYVPKH